eukprot:g2644.t1
MTSLDLPSLGFGCWQLGSKGESDYWGINFTDELAIDLVALSVQNGITYMDTAEDYGGGDSEKQLSVALSKLSNEDRDKVIIGSKILPNHANDVRKYTEGTLKRLGIACIDLYMVHWPITAEGMSHFLGTHTKDGGRDYATSGEATYIPPVAKAFNDLMELQKEGKIKHIGVSNFGVEQLKEALATGCKLAVNQLCYNLLFRAIEFEILPFCIENSIQVICYSPLMQGILTGRYETLEDIPLYRRRTRHFDSSKNEKSRHGEKGCESILFSTLQKLTAYSKEIKIPLSDLAIAYPLQKAGISTVIVGATKKEQVLSNANAAANVKLGSDTMKQLDEITDELKRKMGSNCDLWQGVVNGKQTSRIK